jgi:hypothetical protein
MKGELIEVEPNQNFEDAHKKWMVYKYDHEC